MENMYFADRSFHVCCALLCPSAAALPALNTRRSSNFCLVGSHKITLASLGHSKFPLDKVIICLDIDGSTALTVFGLFGELKVNTWLSYSGPEDCVFCRNVLGSVGEKQDCCSVIFKVTNQ